MTENLTRASLDPEEFPTEELGGYERSWALVIGINDYGKRHPRLTNAVNDAREVARVLKEDFGFDYVFAMYDQQASQKEILSWLLDKLPGGINPDETIPDARIGPNDRLIIFFAGHGTTQKGAAGHLRGYLIPQDARHSHYADYIKMSEVREACGFTSAKHILIILDCCFSGVAAIGTMASPAASPRTVDDAYFKRITERKAWQIMTAGDKDEFAADSGARPGHSAFTSALLAGLEGFADHNQDQLITATDLANYIKPEVIRQTTMDGGAGQSPFFNYIAGSGQGDFVFIRKGDKPLILPTPQPRVEPVPPTPGDLDLKKAETSPAAVGTPPGGSKTFNVRNIRTLLMEGFTDRELRRFCFDEAQFKPVYDQFSQHSGKDVIVDKIIEYAERRDLFEILLNWAEETNPGRYQQYQPYY
ncbi:MAG: caspase family protein [Anaerolineae bacterium]|nr:caspase family protein [Anaerolineae bacterium]